MKLFFALVFFVSLFFVTGCEGYRCGTGRVVDRLTGLPLDSVLCEVLTGIEKSYTDSSGRFDLCNQFGGCVPDCKDIVIQFSKMGYKTIKVENPDDTVIYLDK